MVVIENEEQLQEGEPPSRAKRRRTCTCGAYPWPHRPGGGLCRFPDPPEEAWKGKASSHAPVGMRRRSAIRRRLLARYNLHPIRDREKIRRWLPKLYVAYCRRYGHPYAEWWVGSLPAMRVKPEGKRKLSVPPAEQAIEPVPWDRERVARNARIRRRQEQWR